MRRSLAETVELDPSLDATLSFHAPSNNVYCTSHKRIKSQDHPLFGLEKGDKRSVRTVMEELRKPRHDAL